MSAPDFKAMGDPLNDRLPPRRRAGAADPVIAWVGPVAILHGERDDSEMCLCGRPEYLTCPDWLAGNGTVSSLIFSATPEAVECTCPFRWTTHYRSCPLYVPDSEVES